MNVRTAVRVVQVTRCVRWTECEKYTALACDIFETEYNLTRSKGFAVCLATNIGID